MSNSTSENPDLTQCSQLQSWLFNLTQCSQLQLIELAFFNIIQCSVATNGVVFFKPNSVLSGNYWSGFSSKTQCSVATNRVGFHTICVCINCRLHIDTMTKVERCNLVSVWWKQKSIFCNTVLRNMTESC